MIWALARALSACRMPDDLLHSTREASHRKKKKDVHSQCITTGMNSTREHELVQRGTSNRHQRNAGACDTRKVRHDDVGRQNDGETDLQWCINQLRQSQVSANGTGFRIMLFRWSRFVCTSVLIGLMAAAAVRVPTGPMRGRVDGIMQEMLNTSQGRQKGD